MNPSPLTLAQVDQHPAVVVRGEPADDPVQERILRGGAPLRQRRRRRGDAHQQPPAAHHRRVRLVVVVAMVVVR